MNKRHAVSEMYCRGIIKFIQESKHEFELVACISEKESEEICLRYGVQFCYAENKTTGYKWNRALEYAKTLEWDYLMIMGDDDLIHPDAWEFIDEKLNAGVKYFGFDRIFFHHLQSGAWMKYVIAEPHGGVIGCGRLIARECVDKIGLLWLDEQETGCDKISGDKLRKAGYEREIITECLMVDIKTEYNVWKFGQYKHAGTELSHGEKEFCNKLLFSTL